MRRHLRTLAGLGALIAASAVAERVIAHRIRGRRDTELDRLYVPPSDLRSLTVATHDGGTLHLLERGEGRPVLLLHGITLNAELWSPQLHQLPEHGFRVLSLDHRGHGRSTAGSEGYGMGLLARDAVTVLTELDLRDVVLVGHSMGGMAALNLAVDHPEVLRERVCGLGLVATAAGQPVLPVLGPGTAALGATIVERLDGGRPVPGYGFTGNDLSLFLCRSVFGARPSAAAIEQVRASIEATDQDAVLRSLAGILSDHDTTDRLGDVDVPAFVAVGTRDLLTPPRFARAMAERLPDAELTVLPGAGHQLMQERPDEITRLIRELADRSRDRARVRPAAAAGPL